MPVSNDIHIALAFDENYLNQFYALSTSIFTNSISGKIILHAITSGVCESDKEQIRSYVAKNNSDIFFYDVPDNFGFSFPLNGNWTPATYYRLLLPELLPKQVHKYIYIDTDTLVVGDLAILYSINIDESVAAAVRDKLVYTRPSLGIIKPNNYFNAGVLLINKRLWLEQMVTQKAVDFLTKHPDKADYADQDALNYILKDNWVKLDTKFNLMFADIPEDLPRRSHKEYLSDKVILHFTQHRPWNILSRNPLGYLYHQYLKKSPFLVKKKYVDFSYNKLPSFGKIKLIELYINLPFVKVAWRSLKAKMDKV